MEVITTHINADFDAVGSMIAAKLLYPKAVMVFSGGGERTLRDFFIQSTLYSLGLETPKEIDLEKVTRLIVVDTRQRDRIGKFEEIVDSDSVEVHVYDHHPDGTNDIEGDYQLIRNAGSCVSIMTEELKRKGLEINGTEATIMALGIYEDTGSLSFTSTTPEDYHAAAYLLENGANLSTVSDIMSNTLSKDQVFVLADLIRNVREFNIQGFKVCITEASIDKFQDELNVVVNRVREIENLDVVIALIRAEHKVHLIARSRTDAFDVAQVAKHFGGGGHKFAAAATIKNMTLIEAREALQGCLQGIMQIARIASNLMSSPVKSIGLDATIDEARRKMIRYNVNVLPVIQDGKTKGFITRAVVSRAMHHLLQGSKVTDLMSTGIKIASPNMTFPELYNMVVGHKQRLVPVEDNGKLVGVITRTDILNNLLDEQTSTDIKSEKSTISEKAARPAYFRDMNGLLKSALSEDLLNTCKVIGQTAAELEMTAYFVGGFVRDLILRRPIIDIDIVVEGDAIKLAETVGLKLGVSMAPHAEFKTAVLRIDNDIKIDFATARLEYYEQPAALPTVEESSIKLDLMRRDFSINTLIIHMNPGQFGELVDYFGAYQDIRDGQIRVLHNLSFIEDPTRILRAIRFKERFNFKIGGHTRKLLEGAIKSGFLGRVDGRRMIGELRQTLDEEEPLPVLKKLFKLGVIQYFNPNLSLKGKKGELLDQVEDVLSWYDLLYLNESIERWKVWLFGLIGALKKKHIVELFERLEMDKKVAGELIDERFKADDVLNKLYRDNGKYNSRLFHICETATTEGLLLVMAKSNQQSVKKAVSNYLTDLRNVQPQVNGQDLIDLGFEPGPIFTEILNAVRDARLDGFVKDKEQETAFIMGKFSRPD